MKKVKEDWYCISFIARTWHNKIEKYSLICVNTKCRSDSYLNTYYEPFKGNYKKGISKLMGKKIKHEIQEGLRNGLNPTDIYETSKKDDIISYHVLNLICVKWFIAGGYPTGKIKTTKFPD